MRLRNFSVLALCGFFLLVSCSDDDPTGPSNNNNNNDTTKVGDISDGLFPVEAMENVEGIFASFNLRAFVTEGVSNDVRTAYAFFKGPNVNSGTMDINGIAFDTPEYKDGWTSYQTWAPTSLEIYEALVFEGNEHTWTVDGSGHIPAFSESITTPTEIELNAPVALSTVSKSEDLFIFWEDKDPSTANWYVLHVYDQAGNRKIYTDRSSTGSMTLKTWELSGFQGIWLNVQIIKINYKVANIGGAKYSFVAEFATQVSCLLQD